MDTETSSTQPTEAGKEQHSEGSEAISPDLIALLRGGLQIYENPPPCMKEFKVYHRDGDTDEVSWIGCIPYLKCEYMKLVAAVLMGLLFDDGQIVHSKDGKRQITKPVLNKNVAAVLGADDSDAKKRKRAEAVMTHLQYLFTSLDVGSNEELQNLLWSKSSPQSPQRTRKSTITAVIFEIWNLNAGDKDVYKQPPFQPKYGKFDKNSTSEYCTIDKANHTKPEFDKTYQKFEVVNGMSDEEPGEFGLKLTLYLRPTRPKKDKKNCSSEAPAPGSSSQKRKRDDGR